MQLFAKYAALSYGVLGCALLLGVGCGHPDHGSSHAAERASNQAQVWDAMAQRATTQGDAIARAKAAVERNYQLELADLLHALPEDHAARAALESKYAALRAILAREISAYKSAGEVKGLALNRFPVAYNKRELQAVRKVMADFGDLYIAPTPISSNGTDLGDEVQRARPWAGYWYPIASSVMYEGGDAPLVKFDRLLEAKGIKSGSASWERDHRVAGGDSWEGMCGAWATAAVTTPEPRHPIMANGILFTIADQKALLTKSHELYPATTYGIRYRGDADTDGTYQDIRPEGFQRLVLAALRERKLPLTIDDDPGVEVWNKPLYRMRWTVKADPQEPNAFLVRAWPWLIGQRDEETDVLTTDSDRISPEYNYRLFVDPANTMGDRMRVIAGEWLGDSYRYHPDTVSIPSLDGGWASLNPELNAHMDELRHLLSRGTDETGGHSDSSADRP